MRISLLALLLCCIGAVDVFSQRQITLEQVIALALEQNYDVRIARQNAESAQVDDNYSYTAFLPRVNATGAVVWTNNEQELRLNSPEGGLIEREGPTASKNLTGAVNLEWTIFDGLRVFATRDRIELLAEQGELLVKNQMTNTIAAVTNSYFDIVRQKQQLKAIKELMDVNEVRVQLAERRFQVGTSAKPELLQARVDYNATRAQAIQQEVIIDQLKDQLNGLLGMQLPDEYDVGDTIIVNLNIAKEEILTAVETKNFSVLSARKGVDVATAAIRERRAEYLPFLNVNAAYNYSRLDNTRLLNPFSPFFVSNTGLNYGLTLSVPIFNGLNQRRLVQQSRIAQMQAETLFQQQRMVVNVAALNAFTSYENSRRLLLVEEENISLAKENVVIALEVFRRGAGTVLDLRTAQQSLADAYTRLINARYLAKLAETELLRLNGMLLK